MKVLGKVSSSFNYLYHYIDLQFFFVGDYYEDERDRHKSSRYAYDEDYYSRKSRNDPECEHRREKKTASASSYYQQSAATAGYAGYDQQQYTYYQQKQYYETLRRTNPQAYEWYMNYYGMMQQAQLQVTATGMPTDDISIHSGYSSNNEKDR